MISTALEKKPRRNLKLRIKDSGKTSNEVAALAGISKTSLSQIITGDQEPRISTAQRIAIVLGAPTDEVFPPDEPVS